MRWTMFTNSTTTGECLVQKSQKIAGRVIGTFDAEVSQQARHYDAWWMHVIFNAEGNPQLREGKKACESMELAKAWIEARYAAIAKNATPPFGEEKP